MANMTDYLETALIGHLFRTATYTKPTQLGIALSTATQSDACTGGSMSEVANSAGYGRMPLPPLDTNWAVVTGTGSGPGASQTSNTPAISFTQATGSWGTVTTVVITDNNTYGAGNALFYGDLTVSKAVTSGDTFSFASGALTVQLDN